MTGSDSEVDRHRYAQTEEEAERRAALWHDADPFPTIPPALLNSADLDDYIAATAMLSPWPVKLASGPLMKAATCCLPIGGDYLTFDAPSGKLVRLRPSSTPGSEVTEQSAQSTWRVADCPFCLEVVDSSDCLDMGSRLGG